MAGIDRLLRHKIFLQRLAAGQAVNLMRIIKKELFELDLKLRQGKISKNDITKYTDALEVSLNKLFYRSSLEPLKELLEYEVDFNYKILNKAITSKQELNKPVLKDDTLEKTKITPQVGSKAVALPTVYKSLARNVADTVNRRVTRAIDQNNKESITETKGKSNNPLTAALGLSLLSTVGTVRAVSNTVVNHTSFVAMDELMAANNNVIQQVVWVSTLDDAVCEDCEALEGQTWDLEDFTETPPLHFSCRCILAPVEVLER